MLPEPPNEPPPLLAPQELPLLPQQPEPTPSAPKIPAEASAEAKSVAPERTASPPSATPVSAAAASGAVIPAADAAAAEAVVAYPPADATKSVPPPPIGTRRLPHPFNLDQKRTQQGFCWGCGATPEEAHSSSCNVKRPRLEDPAPADPAPSDPGDQTASEELQQHQQLVPAESGEGSSSVEAVAAAAPPPGNMLQCVQALSASHDTWYMVHD